MASESIEAERAKLMAGAGEIDRAEEGATQNILSLNIATYYSSTEQQRREVHEQLQYAVREHGDIFGRVGTNGPGYEFRHKWPTAARNALLALWATPREG